MYSYIGRINGFWFGFWFLFWHIRVQCISTRPQQLAYKCKLCTHVLFCVQEIILCMRPANERRPYNRKYKDYVYRKMLVQEYLKKWRIFKRVKPKNDMMYHDIYNCICQNTKKFIIHYVKPTAQLLFRIRFPKGGPTCRRQVVNPRHQTSQGQSVAKPETPLQNIQVE